MMSWMAFGFWASVIGALARALTARTSTHALVRQETWGAAVPALLFVALVANTVVAVRRLPPTDSENARNSIWAIGMCGVLLAAALIAPW
jgi:hypothetical protein